MRACRATPIRVMTIDPVTLRRRPAHASIRRSRDRVRRGSIVFVARACSSTSVGEEIGAWAIGVELMNRCSSTVYADAGDSEQQARDRLADDPITVEPGVRNNVDLIANAAYQPSRYFLAYRIGEDSAMVREFDVQELDSNLVRVVITSDCTLQVPARP